MGLIAFGATSIFHLFLDEASTQNSKHGLQNASSVSQAPSTGFQQACWVFSAKAERKHQKIFSLPRSSVEHEQAEFVGPKGIEPVPKKNVQDSRRASGTSVAKGQVQDLD